jgi:Papain family cysteine protease
MSLPINPGRVKDPEDTRDFLYRATVQPTALAKPAVAYRNIYLGPILNQGQTPHCVAYTSTSSKNRQERIETGVFKFGATEIEYAPGENPAAEWLYAECKKIDGIPNEDGTYARAALTVLSKKGLPAADGKSYKIGAYSRCTSVNQIMEAVQYHGPVLLGMAVDTGWYKPVNGRIPAPNQDVIGGHEILVVGYRDKTTLPVENQGLWIKNSWGSSWGAKGYARLPFSHLETYSDWDAWLVDDTSNSVL